MNDQKRLGAFSFCSLVEGNLGFVVVAEEPVGVQRPGVPEELDAARTRKERLGVAVV